MRVRQDLSRTEKSREGSGPGPTPKEDAMHGIGLGARGFPYGVDKAVFGCSHIYRAPW
jgi:hypothetical protein